MDTEKVKIAKQVLTKARDEMIAEIAQCGTHGGVGRAGNYAPTLVNICKAMDFLEPLLVIPELTDDQKRMAAVRAARGKAE